VDFNQRKINIDLVGYACNLNGAFNLIILAPCASLQGDQAGKGWFG
jgi:hypothetical protein